MRKGKRFFTVEVGENIYHQGKRMWINQVLLTGKETNKDKNGKRVPGEKSEVCACPVMRDNGQILTRSPKYIGTDWSYALNAN